MKSKEKEKSATPTEGKKSQLKLVADQMDKLDSTGNEELIERDEVENTPFVIITINNESFGTFGKYRITETYHTKEQCRVELLKVDWNRIIQITTLINEMLKTNKN